MASPISPQAAVQVNVDDFDPLFIYEDPTAWMTPDPSQNPTWWNASSAETGSPWNQGGCDIASGPQPSGPVRGCVAVSPSDNSYTPHHPSSPSTKGGTELTAATYHYTTQPEAKVSLNFTGKSCFCTGLTLNHNLSDRRPLYHHLRRRRTRDYKLHCHP